MWKENPSIGGESPEEWIRHKKGENTINNIAEYSCIPPYVIPIHENGKNVHAIIK